MPVAESELNYGGCATTGFLCSRDPLKHKLASIQFLYLFLIKKEIHKTQKVVFFDFFCVASVIYKFMLLCTRGTFVLNQFCTCDVMLQLYIPRDLWSGLEKMMAVKLLHSKVESCVDKLLKVK